MGYVLDFWMQYLHLGAIYPAICGRECITKGLFKWRYTRVGYVGYFSIVKYAQWKFMVCDDDKILASQNKHSCIF